MLIWALIAGMTAVAVSIVLVPALRRRPEASGPAEAGEMSVYRDQLAELDRDVDSGLVGAAEAEAARTEISRRLLRAGRRGPATAADGGSRFLPIAAALLLPVVAVGLYTRLGHPTMPDMPFAERKMAAPTAAPGAGQSIEDLVAKVVGHLAANPDDTKGWDLLAPTYMHLGRFELAAAAWRNAIRTGGPDERRLTELGRALTAAADDVVTPEAREAFTRAIEVAPSAVLPRFFLAAGLAQEGKKAEAVEAWRAIVAMAKGDEPWLPDAREELARAEADLTGKPYVPPVATPASPPSAAPAAPGPSAADVEAAALMSPEERAKMIATMVERLKDRLNGSGGTIDDWERLIRAEKLLGRLDDARATLDRARAALSGDAAALVRLDALTTGLKP
ncbi:MAG: c-type cytochrome biogenesis protein CcmI [Siculibacillus sp.]|nr:c-type cytochrome biogenesis protein CcmI [Siculibacillus sp.]